MRASYDHNACPSQMDRTNIMAIARRFVLTNASRAKNEKHMQRLKEMKDISLNKTPFWGLKTVRDAVLGPQPWKCSLPSAVLCNFVK